ncbi:uncharacterized [Tachysurus ichikawai]
MFQGLAAIRQSSTFDKSAVDALPRADNELQRSGRRDTRAEEDAYTINRLAELHHSDEVIIQCILTNMVLAQGISHISAPSVNLAFS